MVAVLYVQQSDEEINPDLSIGKPKGGEKGSKNLNQPSPDVTRCFSEPASQVESCVNYFGRWTRALSKTGCTANLKLDFLLVNTNSGLLDQQ